MPTRSRTGGRGSSSSRAEHEAEQEAEQEAVEHDADSSAVVAAPGSGRGRLGVGGLAADGRFAPDGVTGARCWRKSESIGDCMLTRR